MITKIGKKEKFIPFTTDGKTSVVMWEYKPLLDKNGNETEMGKWMIEIVKDSTLDKIKELILGYYNKQVDEKILSGMTWNNMKIWLSSENQFNYKAAYDIALQTQGATLPVIFKFGNLDTPEYYEFKTLDELSDFYFKTVMHIQNCLVEGWKKKDSIDWELYQ